jgi:glutamate racemase
MDSGVGGLAVLAALQAMAPQVPYVFLADTAWMPYGERTPAELRQRIWQLYQGLRERHAMGSLVLGCNTASSCFHISPAEAIGGPILDIVAPTVRHALEQVGRAPTAKVAMMATVTTAKNRRYQEYLHYYEAPFQFKAFACPGLASAIEDNWHEPLDTILAKSLAPIVEWQPDWIILGCTHYLHIEAQVAAHVGPGVRIINPAQRIAGEVLTSFATQTGQPLEAILQPSGAAAVDTQYYTTGSTATFDNALGRLPDWRKITGQVKPLPLDEPTSAD